MVGRSFASVLAAKQYSLKFQEMSAKFLEATSHYALQGLNPGGHYELGIWTRDASFIIQDWFYSGKDLRSLLDVILYVWSHQIIITAAPPTTISEDYCLLPITKAGTRITYGRGSPNLNYSMIDSAVLMPKHSFEGALPTTIFQDYAEVYGEKPDIDSIALMISATSAVLTGLIEKYMKKRALSKVDSTKLDDNNSYYYHNHHLSDDDNNNDLVAYDYLLKAIDKLIPCLHQAIDYLKRQDIDGDGLLEQGYNEDWMDTALRSGKIVYSQACWLLALRKFYSLLSIVGYSEQAKKEVIELAKRTISAVEEKLWSEEGGCYLDSVCEPSSPSSTTTSHGMLTQDVCLYIVALSEYLDINNNNNSNDDDVDLKKQSFALQCQAGQCIIFEETELKKKQQIHERVHKCLDTIRSRIWSKNEFEWPLVTENILKNTGPRQFNKHEYHNHAFWPWITGIEILARSRFGRLDECFLLVSVIASDIGPKDYSLFEWVDPNTMTGKGAVPFRTGISALRLAIVDCVRQL